MPSLDLWPPADPPLASAPAAPAAPAVPADAEARQYHLIFTNRMEGWQRLAHHETLAEMRAGGGADAAAVLAWVRETIADFPCRASAQQ